MAFVSDGNIETILTSVKSYIDGNHPEEVYVGSQAPLDANSKIWIKPGSASSSADVKVSDGSGWNEVAMKRQLLEIAHPVGSLFWTAVNYANAGQVSNALGGGTWQRIKDRFIWAAGDDDIVDSTGGSKDAIVVEHTHDADYSHTHEMAHTHTMAHTHSISHTHGAGSTSGGSTRQFVTTSNSSQIKGGSSGSSYYVGNGVLTNTGSQSTTTSGAASSSTTSAPSASETSLGTGAPFIGETGSSGTDANMPPYVVKYCWERIA